MSLDTIIALIIGLGVGGWISTLISNTLEKHREVERRKFEWKEQQYRNFLESALAFFEGWVDIEKQREFMRSLYTHAPLYASDNIIHLANQFIKSFNDKDLGKKGKSDLLYRKLVLEIRKEMKALSTEDTNLIEDDIDVSKLDTKTPDPLA